MQITFNNTNLTLVEDSTHEFLFSNKDVAMGYGITIAHINMARNRNSDDLVEGKHFIRINAQTNGGKQTVVHWTKRGIVRLGFCLKSEKAKAFRDWAEDYVIDGQKHLQIGQEQYDLLKETVIQQNAQIAQLTIELKSKPKRLPPPPIDNTLKQTLIKVHDGYHRILTTCSPIDMIKELSGMTCLFQLIGSTIGDGKNLNTQTKAGHAYWGDINKIQKPKLLK
ncbi:MAG: hypothetical protein Q7T77_04925 [Sulfuricurvum sp.]|nr:hypothetical protein [Sulfuricurvum sp.]